MNYCSECGKLFDHEAVLSPDGKSFFCSVTCRSKWIEETKGKDSVRVSQWLWSNPDLPRWKRLLLGWFYVPYLIYCWMAGSRVVILKDLEEPNE